MADPLRGLTQKERQFAINLVNGQRMTEAALNAGYSEKVAAQEAYQVIQRDHVKRAIKELRQPGEVYGRTAIRRGIDDAIDLFKEIVADKTFPIKLRLKAAQEILDRSGIKFDTGPGQEVNVGLGVSSDDELGELEQVVLNMKQFKEDED